MLWLGAVAAHYNCGGIIPAPMKKQIVDLHNELRGKLKNGEVDGEKRKLPRAKNMPQLEWDCGLESEAVKRCSNGRINVNLLGTAGYNDDTILRQS
ncbi:hypothetical protein NECAME_07490 [Necator americanus]|uniref:SCP domain-containing protein n=1 Tax=Necator americanus TaxID=51031 RepID=W2TNL8_NECAM|nr:hypothetical protein NECAME_07490 [Necator americanus]ETN83254.1 hypothetical protein NECAME_07490 [Necator americanus]